MQEIEEKLSHLIKSVEDLSDVVTEQSRQLDQLNSRVKLLMEREAMRDHETGGEIILSDTRPPHW